MLPVRGQEIIECQQLVTIFCQTPGGLGILRLIGRDEAVKGFVSLVFDLGLPDRMERGFGLTVERFGQLIQHIDRFVYPAALAASGRKDFGHRRPKTHCTIADGQRRCHL